MPSYRFCRSDDIPLLVDAYNRCYAVHMPGEPELTVEGFKRLTRSLDLWTSSCMVASSDDGPLAVLLAAKRETENLIYRIAVAPEHRRQGHGRHLLSSLSQKMAILGPPRLLAEVPAARQQVCEFFEACGYRRERVYTDFVSDPLPAAPKIPAILAPITASEALAEGDLSPLAVASWERSLESLRNLEPDLRGWGVVSDVCLEAFVLYRDLDDRADGSVREIVAIGNRDPELAEPMAGLLLVHLRRTAGCPLILRKAHPEEIGFDALERWGFRPAHRTVGFSARAAPG